MNKRKPLSEISNTKNVQINTNLREQASIDQSSKKRKMIDYINEAIQYEKLENYEDAMISYTNALDINDDPKLKEKIRALKEKMIKHIQNEYENIDWNNNVDEAEETHRTSYESEAVDRTEVLSSLQTKLRSALSYQLTDILNKGPYEELIQLRGIGHVRALRIIQAREDREDVGEDTEANEPRETNDILVNDAFMREKDVSQFLTRNATRLLGWE